MDPSLHFLFYVLCRLSASSSISLIRVPIALMCASCSFCFAQNTFASSDCASICCLSLWLSSIVNASQHGPCNHCELHFLEVCSNAQILRYHDLVATLRLSISFRIVHRLIETLTKSIWPPHSPLSIVICYSFCFVPSLGQSPFFSNTACIAFTREKYFL